MTTANPVAIPKDAPEIIYRAATPDDMPLIYSNWLESYRASPLTRYVPNALYYAQHKALINKLMQRSQTIMICNPDQTDQVFGWCCYELILSPGATLPEHQSALIVHYAYVKDSVRNLGLAKQLISTLTPPDAPIMCTHTGKSFKALKDKYHLIYNPYYLAV